LHYFQFRIK